MQILNKTKAVNLENSMAPAPQNNLMYNEFFEQEKNYFNESSFDYTFVNEFLPSPKFILSNIDITNSEHLAEEYMNLSKSELLDSQTSIKLIKKLRKKDDTNINKMKPKKSFSLDLLWTYLCDTDDNRTDLDFQQPFHLQLSKPHNTDLWKMRKPHLAVSAGYSPSTGYFRIEFDNNAEELLCIASKLNEHTLTDRDSNERDVKEQDLLTELQVTLSGMYNSRLEERLKRKSIIMDYGLMNFSGTKTWYSKLESSHGQSQAKKLVRLCRLLKSDEAEYVFALLEFIEETRAKTNKLIHYRSQHGIVTKRGMEIFDNERKKRDIVSQRVDINTLIIPPTVKRKKNYMQIFHLPRFRDLSVSEAELCSSISLNPEFFLQTKEALIADCKKNNGQLLKRARKMVKIDVNKTRKIFDLLMEQGLIWLPAENITEEEYKRKRKRK